MSQVESGIDLGTSLGYVLKEASSALHAAMDAVLRPLGMNVTHYSCLELLSQRPGLSNSELARGAFVSRQSMNVLLHALEKDGVVTRAELPGVGRALPTVLTAKGRRELAVASAAVKTVENRMKSTLSEAGQASLAGMLRACVTSLGTPERSASGDDAPAQAG